MSSVRSSTVARSLRTLVRSIAQPWAHSRAHAGSDAAERRLRAAVRSAVENLEGRTLFTVFPVTSVADAGAGTLRDAIAQANANAGADVITFGIGGATTIKPATPLPDITDPVTIDGTTQPGFNTSPIVRLDGEDIPVINSAVGLRFAAGSSGSTVRGLSIHRFDGAGIRIEAGVSNVTVAGNWIGLTDDGTGTFIRAQVTGINVLGSNNTIGGTTAADRNVISGNQNGVVLNGLESAGNVVIGNRIGTTANGTDPAGNELAGVLVLVADHNTIGGTAAGAGNVIADNGFGVVIANTAHDNAVEGNAIGLNVDGEALGNKLIGVEIKDADHNTIGGATEASRNVISANGIGVEIIGAGTTENVVAQNFVGTDFNGIAPRGNLGHGIEVGKNAADNLIGGAGAGNVISGNGGAGLVFSSGASHNAAQGNFIGTSALGFAEIHNVSGGVFVDDADDNLIGGAGLGEGNLVSGNGGAGVLVVLAQRTSIQGNRIGTDAGGTSALGNVEEGILVGAGSLDTTIGGTAPGAGNLISGNSANAPATHSGITVSGTDTNNTVIQGNLIGTDVTGTVALSAGQFAGVRIEDTLGNGASNLIGGDTPAARNVISGNKRGVYLSNANDVRVFGNYIGTDVTGTKAVPNLTGVELTNGSEFNDIGDFGNAATGNVISGNTGDGIFSEAAVNDFASNRIGTNAAGDAGLGNGLAGIHSATAANDARNNLISGNGTNGYFGEGSNNLLLFGNRIGTNAAGNATIPNGGAGIFLDNSDNARIGIANSGNLISGNASDGIRIDNSHDVTLLHNLVGTDVTGTKRLANGGDGVFVGVGSNHTLIGGTLAGAGNVISGNGRNGVEFAGADNFNIVQGNKIGTDVTGTAAVGNLLDGVHVTSSSSNLIGGSVPEAANIIAFNVRAGVVVNDGSQNSIRRNAMFSNAGLGIDLNGDGVTPNDALDADTLSNNRQNFPVLTSAVATSAGDVKVTGTINSTPNKVLVLDFYSNTALDGAGGSEGRTFLGTKSVSTDANGNASFDVTLAGVTVAAGQFITATANTIDTDPFVDTSEFSSPLKVAPAKPTLSIGDVVLTEGKNGTKAFTFTVTLSAPATSTVSVNFATQDGAATVGNKDYAAKAGTLTFAAGETSKTITVLANGDNKKESDESFFLNLTSPVNADILDGQAVGTIKNDD